MRACSNVNILLIEIVNQNLGDAVIADNTEFLIRRALPFINNKAYNIRRYDISSADYEMVARADLIVFAGGGIIKYKYEKFYLHISQIIEWAEKNDIPVYFNGVGVEDYDEDDEKCIMLKRALNSNCIKGISVRDDLETLRTKYLHNTDKLICKVTDPAIFTNKVYNIKRKRDSEIIGIGVARSKIFAANGLPEITKEFQLEMLAALTKNLEARGVKWQLFVNGMKSDYEFAQEALAYMGKDGKPGEYIAARPVESRELVELISSYKGIAAYRMHANIIAYSLGIPSVGIVWNDKLKFWGERIGYPERFLTKENFDGEIIADRLCKSVDEGIKRQKFGFRSSVYRPLKKFIRKYGREALAHKKNSGHQTGKWQDKLAATALGSKNLRYINMNSPITIEKSAEDGFKYLEADVRMTSDGKLVCVNGWTAKTYKALGVDADKYGKTGMPYSEFMACVYYERYPTMDLEQLVEILGTYAELKIIIDAGKPSKEKIEAFRDEIIRIFDMAPQMYDRCIIRLQKQRDVRVFAESGRPFKFMYYCPKKAERDEQNITVGSINSFCKKYGIEWISVSIGAYDDETAAELKKTGRKICVLSCMTMDDILKTADKGASLIGSHYISPAQMNEY